MSQRVIIQASNMRISKLGFDVATAAEKDLLLSLGARSNQIIKSGAMDYTSTSLDALQQRTSIFNIPFPAQQSIPDANVAVIGNNIISYRIETYPQYTLTFSASQLTVSVLGPTNPIPRLAYVIFRKQLAN